MEKRTLYISCFLFLITLIAIPIGFWNYECKEISPLNFSKIDHFDLFIEILINNTLFCLLIIIGSLSLNFITSCILFYNGYSWGIQLSLLNCNHNIEYILKSILPHLIFELLWIVIAVYISSFFSILFLKYFNNKISSNEFLIKIKSKNKHILTMLLLLPVSAFIEVYVLKLII